MSTTVRRVKETARRYAVGACLGTLMLVTAGCAADAPSEEVASTADALSVIRGSYFVPVPAELTSVATNPVSVAVLPSRGALRIVYDLPPVVAGDGARIDLTFDGTNEDGSLRFLGDGARASCAVERTEFVCSVGYRDSVPDLAGAMEAIERSAFSSHEKQLRGDVARHFSIDPLGVLRFTVSPHTLHCLH